MALWILVIASCTPMSTAPLITTAAPSTVEATPSLTPAPSAHPRTEPQARPRPGGLRPAALERFAESKRDRGAPAESYADGSAEPSGSGDGRSPRR